MQTKVLFNAQATLGESPIWDSKTQTLYWVDILQKKIYRGKDTLAQLDSYIGCVAPSADGILTLGLHRGISALELNSQTVHPLTSIDSEPPTNRINDGKCDPIGRFIFGTMDMHEKESSGALYSFDGKNNAPAPKHPHLKQARVERRP